MVGHPTSLITPELFGQGTRPVLLERTDARFMDAVKNELGDPTKWEKLKHTVVHGPGKPVRLWQPIHQAFHLGVIEAVCDTEGKPRLDARKIDGAGLVVRRVWVPLANGSGKQVHEGWFVGEDGSQGWLPLSDKGPRKPLDDPDHKRRKPRLAHPVLAQKLAQLVPAQTYSEASVPLYPLPPAACMRAKATLLYGLVPTASLAQSKPPAEDVQDSVIREALPDLLKAGTHAIPHGYLWRRSVAQPDPDAQRRDYMAFLQTLIVAFDVLEDTPAAGFARQVLGKVELTFADEHKKSLLTHLSDARKALIDPPPANFEQLSSSARAPFELLELPRSWPEISADFQRDAERALQQLLKSRLEVFGRDEGRFAVRDAQYVVQAFMRVRRDDGCPSVIVWSDPSEPFTIAPWFARGPGNLPVIELPDPMKDGIQNFKPNATFAVPASLMRVLRNEPDKLLKGEGDQGSGPDLAWLCGFNIPIITLCAFILLNIILRLLNIIFWWLPFVRICLPIPRKP